MGLLVYWADETIAFSLTQWGKARTAKRAQSFWMRLDHDLRLLRPLYLMLDTSMISTDATERQATFSLMRAEGLKLI
jgi:hypothetical protein